MNVSVQAMADDFLMALRSMSKDFRAAAAAFKKAADKGGSLMRNSTLA